MNGTGQRFFSHSWAWKGRTILALVCLLAPAAAAGQGQPNAPQTYTVIVEQSGQPLGDVDVFVFSNGPKPVGKTSAQGQCQVPAGTLTKLSVPATPGARYRAWRTCVEGKIAIVLVPEGMSVTKEQLGCADQQAGAGANCDCVDLGIVALAPKMTVSMPATLTMATRVRPWFHPGRMYARGGAKTSFVGQPADSCLAQRINYDNAGYNTGVDCQSNGTSTGFGAFFDLELSTPWRAVDIGVTGFFERLGSVGAYSSGMRINARTSNLSFSSDTEYSAKNFGGAFGPSFKMGPIEINPFISISRIIVDGTIDNELRAGPLGPVTPTQLVREDHELISHAQWRPGYGFVVAVPITSGLSAFAQFQSAKLKDALPEMSVGDKNYHCRGVAFGVRAAIVR